MLPSDPSCNPRGEGHSDVIKCSDHSANRAVALSIKFHIVLAMHLWLESPLFSLCVVNHKHLASTT